MGLYGGSNFQILPGVWILPETTPAPCSNVEHAATQSFLAMAVLGNRKMGLGRRRSLGLEDAMRVW